VGSAPRTKSITVFAEKSPLAQGSYLHIMRAEKLTLGWNRKFAKVTIKNHEEKLHGMMLPN
jgi:hypothetical protein